MFCIRLYCRLLYDCGVNDYETWNLVQDCWVKKGNEGVTKVKTMTKETCFVSGDAALNHQQPEMDWCITVYICRFMASKYNFKAIQLLCQNSHY